MSLIKFLRTFLFILSISSICFAQEIVEDENWLKGIGGEADYLPYLLYQYKTFTKEDIANGKLRLKAIRQFAPKNEWEGVYYRNAELGDLKLIWNSEGGFFSLYFYHELKRFDYGGVSDSSNFIELSSDKTSNINKRELAKAKLIKVTIDKKHFLIPESRLQDFCDRAAGLSIHLGDFYYYWTKEADMQKETFGLPVLASEYKQFLRFPIEAEIIRIDKRKTVQSGSSPPSDEIHYPITLNAGRNRKIKRGMNFFAKDLGEWIQITKVLQKSSVGFIRRDFDENKQEQCFDSEGGFGQVIPCKEIKYGMKAKTKGSL